MSNSYRKGQTVSWNWGANKGDGHVTGRFERRVQRTIEGTRIVRHGTCENPAYLVETEEGKVALKLGSELSDV